MTGKGDISYVRTKSEIVSGDSVDNFNIHGSGRMEKMSVYKKILELQKEVVGLEVDKEAGFGSFKYKYLTGNKLLSHIKPAMNRIGLILKQEVDSVEIERIDYKTKNGDKSENLYKVWFKFTWIDTDTGEKDENKFFATGMNEFEKGLGCALTYAERYFIMKQLHLATDEDDIDNPDRKKDDPLKKGVENQSFEQEEKHKKPFNKNLAIKSIMELIAGDGMKLNKQLEYYKIKNLDEATEIQLKSIYKYLSPKK